MAMTDNEPIPSVRGVNSWYSDDGAGIFRRGRKKQVLHDISLTIRDDEFFGLVGESGCGKSTLANCILGLQPCEGEILIEGQKRKKGDTKAFSSMVQAIFQDPLSALDPSRTIFDSMQEPLVTHGIGPKSVQEAKVADMLEAVGLDSTYMHRYPSELSGGQRQRVCIGAALMLQPRLVIADEPVSALDVSIQAQILNLFRQIDAGADFSMLFISHNLQVVYYLCNRIAVMYRGRIVEMGTADEVVKNPKHPYTKLLLASIPGAKREADSAEAVHRDLPRGEVPENGCPYYERCPVASARCRLKPAPVLSPVPGAQGEHVCACTGVMG